ncbi:MAG: nucleotide exchange factor GrpE [Oceanococcus sp.]
MQDEPNAKPEQPADQIEPKQTAAAEEKTEASGQTDQPGDNDIDSLKARLAEAEAKSAENWERCLRATAEQDNIRKRAEREVAAARRFALEKFAQDLLGVADSLELGLKAAQDAGADEKQIEGAQITSKMLADVLKRHGVEVIDPQGENFDPEKHEAMAAVPNADVAPNTVLDVMQKGYSLNERVLRPAMVAVSRAVPSGEGA